MENMLLPKQNNMKKKLRITIGIPAYNEEANIKNLLFSLVAQKQEGFTIYEIIVLSDGSSDQTVQKVKEIPGKLITVVDSKKRLGPNKRLNQLIAMMSKKSDGLLLFEADTLPKTHMYIKKLILSVPEDRRFSVVYSTPEPMQPRNIFEKVMYFGQRMKEEIFSDATDDFNLYMCSSSRLLSKQFLKTFTWREDLHEDSYCYRQALMSGLPIIKNKAATIKYKLVSTLHDYLLQSIKFQKAREKEENFTNIYRPHINYKKALTIIVTNGIKDPLLFVIYLSVVGISRVRSLFAQEYTPLWKIYRSTKTL